MNKINDIKKFLMKEGFSNAVFSGDEKKPQKPFIAPSRLIHEVEPVRSTPEPLTKANVYIPPASTDPWDIFLWLGIDKSSQKYDCAKHLQKLWEQEKADIKKLNMTAEYSDDYKVFKSEKDIIQMRAEMWKLTFNPWRQWLESNDSTAYPSIQFETALSLIEFGAKNKDWDILPLIKKFVSDIPEKEINSWMAAFVDKKEDILSSIVSSANYFAKLESEVESSILLKSNNCRDQSFTSRLSV
jgi:hypothetical protein